MNMIVSASAVASATIAPCQNASGMESDPIYSMIEEHKAARAAWLAALDTADEVKARLPRRSTPRILLGYTLPVELTIKGETKEIPGGPFYATQREHIVIELQDDIARRDELLAEWDRLEAEKTPPELSAAEERESEALDAEQAASVALLTTSPTTIAGAVTLLRYLADTNTDGCAYENDCGEAGDHFAALIASLTETLAPLAARA